TDEVCCLAHFHQATKVGKIEFTVLKSRDCKFSVPMAHKTAHSSGATIDLQRLDKGNCDTTADIFKKGPLTMKAHGPINYRADGLAHFAGDFSLSSAAGIAFKGRAEVLFRVGSHSSPVGTEPCDPENHAEGWLVGHGPGDLTLRAQLALKYQGSIPAGLP